MPEPLDITQLDLQNLSPEEAAALARAHQQAAARQQQHALVGILSAMPEAQKAGAMEYTQAGEERKGGQQTAANVLKQTLGEREATARIKEMELQGKQMMGMLSVAMGRQKLEQEHETFQQKVERFKAELAAQRQPTGALEADLVKSATRLAWAKKLGAPKVAIDLMESDHKAMVEAAKQMGYMGGGPPKWPGETAPIGAGVSPAVPLAPGAGGGNVNVAPQAADPWGAMRQKYGGK